MRRILLTGATGQLGYELMQVLSLLGEVLALNRHELDLAEPLSVRQVIRQFKPDWVINAAAYMAVEAAQKEAQRVLAINTQAPVLMAEELRKTKGVLVHFTTGYVFDGTKSEAYEETDRPNPVNAYGLSQWQAEQGIEAAGGDYLIFRTGWRYSLRRTNFVVGMKNRLSREEEIQVVDDQIGNPTWVKQVASALLILLSREGLETGYIACKKGLYHLASSGKTSWFGLAQAVSDCLEQQGRTRLARLKPVTTLEQGLSVLRPLNSTLSSLKFEQAFGFGLPDWRLALLQCLQGTDE
ncbi:MAG: dTDP-4-dehydrorhamnose reductase [Pseudomonadota bacterium]|nr:dTDP-4-dehydrorhamnose reductase [Pseudomonadota bacterium]